MRRIGANAMVATAALLLGAGWFLATWSSRHGADESAARRARLQAFVGARHDLVTHPVRVVSPSPVPAGLALATFEIAGKALEARSTATLLQRLVVETAVAERAAAWPVLAPILQALAAVVGTERRCSGVPSEVHQALRVAQLYAVDRRAWTEQVAWWAIASAVFERSRPESMPCCFGSSWPDARLWRLDRAALVQLGGVVRGLDERTVPVDDVRTWLRPRVSFLLLPSVPPRWRDRLAAWQHGFDAYERERIAADELIAALPLLESFDVPWSVRQHQWRRVADGIRLGAGARLVAGLDAEWEFVWRQELARLRLLRLVIAWRLGEPLPNLLDPFTLQPIALETRGDDATFRCAAPGMVLVRHSSRAFAREPR